MADTITRFPLAQSFYLTIYHLKKKSEKTKMFLLIKTKHPKISKRIDTSFKQQNETKTELDKGRICGQMQNVSIRKGNLTGF